MDDIKVFVAAAGACACLTPLLMKLARRWGVVDYPTPPRKLHHEPIPLLGGVSIYLTLLLLGIGYWSLGFLTGIPAGVLVATAIAGAVLVVGGSLDDRLHLRPSRQILFPLLAVLLLILAGVRITFVSNPFGGVLQLPLLIGIPITAAWLLGLTYTTKLLDGLDGLVAGVTVIAAVVIYAVSIAWDASGGTGRLALLVAGAALGFLVYNVSPARVFLGEGGSTLLGMLLAMLAVVSGSKVATAVLVFGVPVFDAAAVLVARRRSGESLVHGDRRHLHFRLVELGLPPSWAVLLYWAAAAGVGIIALNVRTWGKLIAIGLLMLALSLTYAWLKRRHQQVLVSGSNQLAGGERSPNGQ